MQLGFSILFPFFLILDALVLHGRHTRVSAQEPKANSSVSNRDIRGQWSWYNTETGKPGACGLFITNDQFVVALSAADFNLSHCFKTVTLSFGGKTTEAVVLDVCPICPAGGLDLSRGLFQFFTNTDEGLIDGNWEWGSISQETPPTISSGPASGTTESTTVMGGTVTIAGTTAIMGITSIAETAFAIGTTDVPNTTANTTTANTSMIMVVETMTVVGASDAGWIEPTASLATALPDMGGTISMLLGVTTVSFLVGLFLRWA